MKSVASATRTTLSSMAAPHELSLGQAMYALAQDLIPFHRSITGPGVRQTLQRLKQIIPLTIHEVPTGTQVFDWTIPQEWSICDAYIRDAAGRRVVDYQQSNLHVAAYSRPVNERLSLRELEPHLISMPDRSQWIPYRSLHFRDDWAFCLSDQQCQELLAAGENSQYEVVIDSALYDGSLSYGELLIAGRCTEEVLITTHVCHPALANDNLSGVAVASYLAQTLAHRDLKYSYRFLFIPATIGAIAWLARNQDRSIDQILYGFVLTCLGDDGHFTYKRSRRGNSPLDRAAVDASRGKRPSINLRDFEPHGYDERQFNSPAFDLPMARLTRTPNGEFAEYHTSADDLSFIRPENLEASLETCLSLLQSAETDPIYINRHPWCEPPLAKHHLYEGYSHEKHPGADLQQAVMWALNLSDGKHSLGAIADRADIPYDLLAEAARRLTACGLLMERACPREK